MCHVNEKPDEPISFDLFLFAFQFIFQFKSIRINIEDGFYT